MRNNIRFLKNIVVLLILGALGIMLYKKMTTPETPDLILSETPLHVESIKKIAELATINFKDEVVSDSIERYRSESEKIAVNLDKLMRFQDFVESAKFSPIKRQFTMIVKGEAQIGFDLTEHNYKIDQNVDTIWFHFPKAKILTININPANTEIFQENGDWNVNVRTRLSNKAKMKIERDVIAAKLIDKAEEGMVNVLKKIMPDDRTILVYFE